MDTYHAAVWLDHHEARIFHLNLDDSDESTVRAPKQHVHRHPKGGTAEHNHPDDAHHFFRDVAKALQGAQEILVGGRLPRRCSFSRTCIATTLRSSARSPRSRPSTIRPTRS